MNRLKHWLFISLRVLKYRWVSTCESVSGSPNLYQPLQVNGEGKVAFGKNVSIGVANSPGFYTTYAFFEVRKAAAEIRIGDNVSINNNFCAIAFSSIEIGNDVLIGANCSIIDSDGHDLSAQNRQNEGKSSGVVIGHNVFLGSNVTVLKGVSIGDNSIIGNGSVVTKSLAPNSVAAGNPARLIRTL